MSGGGGDVVVWEDGWGGEVGMRWSVEGERQ